MARVVVIGAGVVGLSCAVRLLEAGHQASVVARDLPLETTSGVAPALWYPYRAYPFERVTGWAASTYAELVRLAQDDRTGVRVVPGVEVFRAPTPQPWWSAAVPHLARATEVPDGFAAGWALDAPVAEMPVYLRWLAARVEELGGTVTRMALSGIPDGADVVVVAAGLGARLFADDGSVVPVRSQALRLEQVGLERWVVDAAGPTYVVPRSKDVVVAGLDEEGRWDRTPDDTSAKELLERARALVPELRRAKVLGLRAALAPARPSVRLEETAGPAGNRVVHCYGHGGAGVTLSWGCADEVAALVGSDAVASRSPGG